MPGHGMSFEMHLHCRQMGYIYFRTSSKGKKWAVLWIDEKKWNLSVNAQFILSLLFKVGICSAFMFHLILIRIPTAFSPLNTYLCVKSSCLVFFQIGGHFSSARGSLISLGDSRTDVSLLPDMWILLWLAINSTVDKQQQTINLPFYGNSLFRLVSQPECLSQKKKMSGYDGDFFLPYKTPLF